MREDRYTDRVHVTYSDVWFEVKPRLGCQSWSFLVSGGDVKIRGYAPGHKGTFEAGQQIGDNQDGTVQIAAPENACSVGDTVIISGLGAPYDGEKVCAEGTVPDTLYITCEYVERTIPAGATFLAYRDIRIPVGGGDREDYSNVPRPPQPDETIFLAQAVSDANPAFLEMVYRK